MTKSMSDNRLRRADFELRQLEIFCKVVEMGSVSRAAEAVNLTQSSVSERMSSLEKSIGVKLFDRVGRRNVLTRSGELLYELALKHLALKEETLQALEGFQGVRRGEIIIGGSTIPGEYILPEVISGFHQKYPKIRVRLKIMDTGEVIEDVANGELAFGIVGAVIEREELLYDKLWSDELVLITGKSHPWARRKSVSVVDLLAEPFIVREAGSGTRRLLERHLSEAANGRRTELNVVAELGSSAAIKAGVIAGLGVSVISSRAVAQEAAAGTVMVVPITGLKHERFFYMVRDKRRTISPLAAAFADFMRKISTK